MVREDSKIILREPFEWCVMIDGHMPPIADFLRGLLCKPSLEVQTLAAFTSLCETYEPDFHARTIKWLDEDGHLRYLRTMV